MVISGSDDRIIASRPSKPHLSAGDDSIWDIGVKGKFGGGCCVVVVVVCGGTIDENVFCCGFGFGRRGFEKACCVALLVAGLWCPFVSSDDERGFWFGLFDQEDDDPG
jgi:hypothetical protein